MSTATFTAAAAAVATRGESHTTLFHRTLARVIAAREAKAKRLVADHLAALSVADLRKLGFSDGEIAGLRAARTQSAGFAI
jgi:hypothetical protein